MDQVLQALDQLGGTAYTDELATILPEWNRSTLSYYLWRCGQEGYIDKMRLKSVNGRKRNQTIWRLLPPEAL